MADPSFREHFNILGVSKYDWMHSALQNGTITEELFLSTSACSQLGYTLKSLAGHLKSEWEFPQSHRKKDKMLWHVFDEFRSRASSEAHRLKASASEVLSIYSIVRHWVATVVGPLPELAAKTGFLRRKLLGLGLGGPD